MQNYKVLLAYDGTDFSGWQRQPARRTVQGVLEEAIEKIAGKHAAVHGAGRTDAGVHAAGQVAGFRGAFSLGDAELFRALNAVLPDDIRILALDRAEPAFHARKSALSKIYEYRIITSRLISPFLFRYALHWPYPFDLEAVKEAAPLFIGEKDFTAFSSNRELHPVRTVIRSEVRAAGDEIVYLIEANGFLRYMVRTIVGTLLDTARGRTQPGAVDEIFGKKDRSLAGPTAPAKGLCLLSVRY